MTKFDFQAACLLLAAGLVGSRPRARSTSVTRSLPQISPKTSCQVAVAAFYYSTLIGTFDLTRTVFGCFWMLLQQNYIN